jgi:hypothetical protein
MFTMDGWSDFFVAIVGAAAALTGLIFVGVSISLTRILSIPRLPSRAAQSLILLLTVLLTCALCLVPDQPAFLLGIEILCTGIIVWVVSLKIDIRMLRQTDAQFKRFSRQNVVFTQLAVVPYIIAGAVTWGQGFIGIYWLIPAIIFSFIKAVLDAWVLLVEIHR